MHGKLREQNSLLQTITVYIKTNRFSVNTKQHRQSIQMNLTSPTDDIIVINKIALFLLGKIYRTGYKYHKVGIMLSGLSQKMKMINMIFSLTKLLKIRK